MRGFRRAWLVARREWNVRVRSRAFRISTLVAVAIVVAIIVVPATVGGAGTPTRTVGLVGPSSPQLPELLGQAGRPFGVRVETRAFDSLASAQTALRSGDVDVVLEDERTTVWSSAPDDQLQAIVRSAVQGAHQQRAIEQIGLSPAEVRQLLAPPQLRSRSLEPATKERSARITLATVGLVLLFMAINFYGGFLLVGVIEEKSSRVVEVLLSRVRPKELLAGKITGIGLVGLAQFVIVAVSALLALAVTGNAEAPTTAPGTIGWILVWFVLGYGFYSVLYASAGSLVSRQEEAQSMTFPIAGVLLVGYVLSFGVVHSPHGGVALVGSFVPPTAPMIMIVRIASGGVAWWQVAASIVLTMASIYGMVLVAARIYAGAILRIGRRVRLGEAWRAAAP
ncbi:MAG TPA: ABC transporter permease [Actinomycetota bacterium]|nr:ABC transporter permease [Actinomycetota bacterium]